MRSKSTLKSVFLRVLLPLVQKNVRKMFIKVFPNITRHFTTKYVSVIYLDCRFLFCCCCFFWQIFCAEITSLVYCEIGVFKAVLASIKQGSRSVQFSSFVNSLTYLLFFAKCKDFLLWFYRFKMKTQVCQKAPKIWTQPIVWDFIHE